MSYDSLPGSEPCLRLVGASSWSGTGSPMDHLLGLRKHLLGTAAATGARVAVLHRAQWLLHWIEGAPAVVDAIWERIQQLPEQESARLLLRNLGAPALRMPVHVAAVFLRESPQHVARQIALVAEDTAAPKEPARVWQEMAAPAVVPPCGSVVVASAQVNDGIDLLRHVAHEQGIEVVYQRFAGPDLTQFDSGTAYADFSGEEACPCTIRVQVLSRPGLRNALVRSGLPPVREVVLLPGVHEGPAERLTESVLPLLAEHGNARVRVVGRAPATLSLAGRLLGAGGIGGVLLPCFARSVAEEASLLEEALLEAERGADECLPWGGAGRALAA